jgi:hypothetical protein
MTPTLYNAALLCPARALWGAYGARGAFPQSPAALLGTAFHAVAEEAVQGWLPEGPDERYESACRMFDLRAREHAAAHPLIRWRYPDPEYLPYYALLRAEAAENARGGALLGGATGAGGGGSNATCGPVTSKDPSI